MSTNQNAKNPQGGSAAKVSQSKIGKIKNDNIKAIGLNALDRDGLTLIQIASSDFDTQMILLDMMVDDLEILKVDRMMYSNASKDTTDNVEYQVLTNIPFKDYESTPWFHWMDALLNS